MPKRSKRDEKEIYGARKMARKAKRKICTISPNAGFMLMVADFLVRKRRPNIERTYSGDHLALALFLTLAELWETKAELDFVRVLGVPSDSP